MLSLVIIPSVKPLNPIHYQIYHKTPFVKKHLNSSKTFYLIIRWKVFKISTIMPSP